MSFNSSHIDSNHTPPSTTADAGAQDASIDESVVTVQGKIDLIGATCTSCAIGIERMGKKLPGVRDVYVDKAESCVYVHYDGQRLSLEKICDFIHRIGYQAHISAIQ